MKTAGAPKRPRNSRPAFTDLTLAAKSAEQIISLVAMRKILTPFCRVHSPDCQVMPFVLWNAAISAIECIAITPRNDALTAFSRMPALLLLLAFAAGLASPARAQSAVAEGQKLAFDRGKGNCLTCHVIKGGDLPGTIGPELKDLKAKYPDRNELAAIIFDETKRNPQTMMPPFGRNRILTDQEISAIVDFLQTL
ncbi:sulfur oxidation protein [Bradyrhizobium diazoefficiens USDA 110]|uniref:Sulfur oxidation protein n=3 Tax=Bradyrhizobium diazoefficiens TaxID=1355477 RepID=Q89VN1_BRADU|nr:sulfur-oxidizing protein SoxX [Bradyrhizobium japonicum]PDT62152.1 sulfur oxidation c-type cytochrome SoxX [Bradyrhizobium diazoefficiens]QBP19953.1 sulfur oxidation c-type cytochrome SoxX [Bradyrhizobium diazoefficiens]BAC46279.1 sulfur oxidation protein [Bradyrhizobium diazoefficiens USDA 110]